MSETKDSFSNLMGAGDSGRRRRRVAPTGPALGGGPSGPAMQGPSGPAMQGPSGPAMRGPSGPAMQGGASGEAPARRRRRAGDDDLMKQLYG
jgi:hypothetical protein